MTVDLNYGRCSDESTAVRRAFSYICVGSYNTCDWTATVPRKICIDEINHLNACAINGFDDFQYRWSFPSTAWNVVGAGNTNTVNGRCARATNIPDQPYYPITVTIRVHNFTTNDTRFFDVELRDCSHSSGGSGCAESTANMNEDNEPYKAPSSSGNQDLPASTIQVYNIAGQMIYEGSPVGFYQNREEVNAIYIIASFDENGAFISSKKVIKLY